MSWSLTYDKLKNELQEWTEERSQEFINRIPTIIGEGELALLRDLSLTLFDGEPDPQPGTTGSQETMDIPEEVIRVRTMYVDGVLVEPRTWEFIQDYNTSAAEARPLYYVEDDENRVAFAPVPDQGYPVRLRGVIRPDGLSASNQNTWLSRNVPDALLYACLVACEAWLQSDDRIETWAALYKKALESAVMETRHLVRSDYDGARAQ